MHTSTIRTNTTSRLVQFVLAAGMVASATLAHAGAPGFTAQARDQQLVKPGMTQEDVRAALGVPARSLHFPASHTTTWTYQRPEGEIVFDVDFGNDGKVIATGERQVHVD